jgi:hypothetical protein
MPELGLEVFVVDDAESELMSNKDSLGEKRTTLIHVHLCIYCGHARLREEVDSREIGSGILHCPQCDRDGPLNVEIRESPGTCRKP